MQGRRLLAYACAALGVAGVGALLYFSLDASSSAGPDAGAASPVHAAHLDERVDPTAAASEAPARPAKQARPAVTSPAANAEAPAERAKSAPSEGEPTWAATLRGQVWSFNGQPVAEAEVELFVPATTFDFGDNDVVPGVSLGRAVTDSSGAFTLHARTPEFAPDVEVTAQIEARSADGTLSSSFYSVLLTHGLEAQTELVLAESCSFTVLLEREFPRVDIRLTGTLDARPTLNVDVNGLTLEDSESCASKEAIEQHEGFSFFDVREDLSRFEYGLEDPLPPGHYRVELLILDGKGQPRWAAGEVQLEAGDHKELLLKPEPLGQLDVTLRKDGVPTPGEVLLTYPDGTPCSWSFAGLAPEDPPESSNTFTFEDGSGSGELVFEGELETVDTNDVGRVTLAVPPGTWRIVGLPSDAPAGRAEAQVRVSATGRARCTLDFDPGLDATVVCPQVSESASFSVFGPPGIRLKGRGTRELVVSGLLPGDRAFVTCSTDNGELEQNGGVVVGRGDHAKLALHSVSYVELELVARGPFSDLNWPVRIEPLDAPSLPPYGPFVTLADAFELWGDMDPDPSIYSLDDFDADFPHTNWAHEIVQGAGDFRLLPGRYRITVEGTSPPVTRQVQLAPGQELLLELPLGR